MAKFLSGFIAILGRPNVGKSTLMNTFVGEKVAIVSANPQTTRNKIQGVLTQDNYQIVFIDTPGIHNPHNRLAEYMVKASYSALEEVEGVLLVLDAQTGIGRTDIFLLEHLQTRTKAPIIVAMNKIDAVQPERLLEQLALLKQYSYIHAVVPVSAITQEGVDELKTVLFALLPEGPKYFPDDMMTDQPERVLCAEFIREKAIQRMHDEIPHGIGVEIEQIRTREEGNIMDIHATIVCERETHKGMIIGKRGAMIRAIGESARMDLEKLLDMHINLQLWVKVREDWRNSNAVLRDLGYYDAE